jgi:hypothetical protein
MTRLVILLTTAVLAATPAYAEPVPGVEVCVPPQVAEVGCAGAGGTVEYGPAVTGLYWVGGSCTYTHLLGTGSRIALTGTFAASPADPASSSVSCSVYVDGAPYKSMHLTGGNPMTFQGTITLPASYSSMYVCWTGSASWPGLGSDFHTSC